MGKFSIIRQVGSGGMANVHLAIYENQLGMKRLCAVKQMRSDVMSAETHGLFVDETNTWLKLSHDNIVRVLDVTEVDDSLSIVMEFVNGVSLDVLQQSFANLGARVPLNLILYVTGEISKGLDYIHNAKDELTGEPLKIIHRDLSPSNILLGSNGEVKITDFGVAKAQINTSETEAGVVKGKYRYMSPEHIQGKALDLRADIYSLGLIVWELLTGKPLFCSENVSDLVGQVAAGSPYSSILEVAPGMDKELAEIVDKMLAKNKDDRFSSAAEVSSVFTRMMFRQKEPYSSVQLQNVITQLARDQIEEINKLVHSQSSAKAAVANPKAPSSAAKAKATQPQSPANIAAFGNNEDDNESYDPKTAQFSYDTLDKVEEKVAVGGGPPRRRSQSVYVDSNGGNAVVNVAKGSSGENIRINVVVPQHSSQQESEPKLQRGRDLTYAGGGTNLNQSMSSLPSVSHQSSARQPAHVSVRQTTLPPQRLQSQKSSSSWVWIALLGGLVVGGLAFALKSGLISG